MAETLIVKMRFGSHVYGTNLPSSDLDFKGVYLPTAEDILLQSVRPTRTTNTKADTSVRNTSEDVDFEVFSLQQFFHLLLGGQTVQVNMLFTPDRWIMERSGLWEIITKQKHKWLHSGIAPFVGYCRQQANKYGIKGSRVSAAAAAVDCFTKLIASHRATDRLRDHWPLVEELAASNEHILLSEPDPGRVVEVCNRKIQEGASLKEACAIVSRIHDEYGARARQAQLNENVDWKAMMHAVRVCSEAQELLTYETITYPRPEADLLLKIRRGELRYIDVANILEEGLARLTECQQNSSLPKEPDKAAARELIRDEYRAVVIS